ncbi:hypothetical protein [Thermodesulfovibrio thiophilus]|uniref:hypothetical protein n=1 Tax=Thermodesulfovibrio thiophilus TaxID=340095 RepID=UPI0018148503|nr:hypothetical protein [Thermodesulfovibrio thiophilus]HHW19994.1 hypothetical protein [Thermodesulfovibrio thiophilus]
MSETLVILLSIGYFLATLSLIAAVIFLIVVAVELRRGINAFKEFLISTKIKLEPAIDDAHASIKGIRSSIDNVNEVTEKIRLLSETVEKFILIVSEFISTFDKVKSAVSLKRSALKTAIRVATSVFIENLKKRR